MINLTTQWAQTNPKALYERKAVDRRREERRRTSSGEVGTRPFKAAAP